MDKDELIQLGLTDEQATKIISKIANNYVAKTEMETYKTENEQLKIDIKTRDKQLEELKKIDAKGLQKKIEELQTENQASKETYEAQIKQIKIDNAIEKALTTAKAKNIKAVKALLDLENTELLEDGTIKNLDKQIKSLQSAEDSKFMFDIKTNSEPTITGASPYEPTDNTQNSSAMGIGLKYAQKYSAKFDTAPKN